MAKRKRKMKARRTGFQRWVPFLLLACFVLILLYLYGQVEIGLNIRENGTLKTKNAELELDIDRLKAEVNVLKSYPRIAEMVKSVPLRPVPAERSGNLEVDLDGLFDTKWKGKPLQYASVAPFQVKARAKGGGGK
jgi:hypothetical protein